MKDGIIIDTRENIKVREAIIKDLNEYGIKYKVKHLKVGDYLICGVLPVERKTLGDFTQSLYSGHLHKQYYELSKNYSLSVVGIIGNHLMQSTEEHGIKLNIYLSALVGTFLKRAEKGKSGIVIPIQVYTEYEFSLMLKFLFEKFRGGEHKRTPKIEQLSKYRPTIKERQISLMASIEGVGEKRAKDLFRKHKSIANLCLLSVESLKMKGIGDKTAEKIWNTLH